MGNSKSRSAFADDSQYAYRPPGPTDSRSPCPALNALANHGYLPHDGKDIPPDILRRAIQEKMGLSWLASTVILKQAYKTVGHGGVLSLADLCHHAPDSIEHDGSLSRLDAALSNNQQGRFNQERFNKFLSFSTDGQTLTTEDVAAARLYFKADSRANNPQYIWNKDIEEAMWTEASILLHILGKNGRISIEDAKLFFEQERFPLGWQRHPSFGALERHNAVKALKAAARRVERKP